MAGRTTRAIWRQLSDVGGNVPAPRSSHTVTSIIGKICVFGGEDGPRNAFDPFPHILMPDSPTSSTRSTWHSMRAPVPGLPLLGHGAASLGAHLHVFGGRLGGPNTFSGDDSGESGDHFVFDMDNDAWGHLKPRSPMPEPRSFHAMCSAEKAGSNGLVFVFGGCGSQDRLNDLWSFDPSTGAWNCLHPGGSSEAPVPRGGSRLVATADGSRLGLLFGFSGVQQGDMAIFDLGTKKWQLQAHDSQKGDVPSPRSVFSAAALPGSDEVFLFGGEREASDLGHAGAGQFMADLHVLDLVSMVWRRVDAEGKAPPPRGWGGMAAQDAKHLILFGGLNAENERLGDVWELALE